MKKWIVIFLLQTVVCATYAQNKKINEQEKAAITRLIDQYSEARDKRDTALLKKILTPEIDQLVSTGEWRTGIAAAVKGMIESSTTNPGARTLKIDKIKKLNTHCALVDCRYEIADKEATSRKMWSSFMVVMENGTWKISAIRNMMPSGK